jgi:hypothetical protein
MVRHGESLNVDEEGAEKFKIKFVELMEESCLPLEVCSVDETGLFWKKMPRRKSITKDEISLPGYKPMKDRLTLLLCSNASGDFKLKPMLVYRSYNPRVFLG